MVLVVVGFGSSLLANIPLVAAMILMLKGYFVVAQLVPEEALGPAFSAWPAASLPVFVAMMFAGTLGGNATLIGASANIVSVGICAAQRQAGYVCQVHALRRPADGVPVGRVGRLCGGPVFLGHR